MYYSAGTYESFAHPEKPQGVDKKSAYIIGTGLAGLTAAFYLVRDGQMSGEHIHLLEKLELAGGSCDGRKDVTKGFFMRGGREMDNHFEVMWDLLAQQARSQLFPLPCFRKLRRGCPYRPQIRARQGFRSRAFPAVHHSREGSGGQENFGGAAGFLLGD